MFISGIEIKGHPLIEDISVNFSIPNLDNKEIGLNYIVGRSGTGKTYLLEAIFPTFNDPADRHRRIDGDEYKIDYRDAGGHTISHLNLSKVKYVYLSQFLSTEKNLNFEIYPTQEVDRPTHGKKDKVKVSKNRHGEEYIKDTSNSGSGERRMVSILEQISERSLLNFDVIVIEEPDTHLDPENQRILHKRIQEVSKTKQVFITTHSPHMVDWNSFKQGATVLKLSRKNELTSKSVVGCFREDNSEGIVSLVINNQMKTQPHLSGVETKNIFFTNNIFLVEGQDDVGCILNYLDQKGLEGNFTFYGYGAGGSNKIGRILDLCSQLKIPKVAVMFDTDPCDRSYKGYKPYLGNATYRKLKYLYKSNENILIEKIDALDIRDKYDYRKHNMKIGPFTEDGVWKGVQDNLGRDFEEKMRRIMKHFSNE